MIFLLSLLLLLSTIFILLSFLDRDGIVHWMMKAYLAGFALIVLVFEILNWMRKVNNAALVLLVQFILLLLCAAAWYLRGRPDLFSAFRGWKLKFKKLFAEKDALTVGLLGVFIVNLILNIVLIYLVPPNNNDALSIHLARAAMWRQQGSLFPWDTVRILQVVYPPNAQLVSLWTLVMTAGDHFAAYFPLVSGLISVLVIYKLTLELGARPWIAIFTSLLWTTLPVVQLHFTALRQDIIDTALLSLAFYFFYLGTKRRSMVDLVFSALAMGLVVGTNMSIVFYLPGFLLILLAAWLWFKRISFKQLASYSAAALGFFLVFSSQVYIVNFIHYGNPVGPDYAPTLTKQDVAGISPVGYVGIDISRWLYQMVDFTGIPQPLMGYAVKAKAFTARAFTSALGIQMEGNIATLFGHQFYFDTIYRNQEDEAWFGPLGALLLIPLAFIQFGKGLRRADFLRTGIGIMFVSTLLAAALLRGGWSPFEGRFFLPLSALAMCLFASLFPASRSSWWLKAAIMLVALVVLINTVVNNPAKPLVGNHAIWYLDRSEKLTLQSDFAHDMLYLADKDLPQDAVLGLATQSSTYEEYGLYGEHFTRKVVPVYPPGLVNDASWLEQRNIQYLLIEVSDLYPPQTPQDFRYLDSEGSWLLLERQ